jgi:glucose-1-phosphate cytidylyltransferase
MKVVLFCGGLGMRLREYSDKVRKPMVNIEYRPIIWHLMKYYAHFGHKDFILCLGYRGDIFKKYFLEYNECDSNDFTLFEGGKKVSLTNNDIEDWTITFADTGQHSNIGQRLKAVQKYLNDEEIFLANYGDGLTDMDLRKQLSEFMATDAIGSFLSVKPNLSYHTVLMGKDNIVKGLQPFQDCDIRINGGFFIFRKKIFDYIRNGEELVMEPFYRLIHQKRLVAYVYDGFWGPMDTFKDKQNLDQLYEDGNAPWELWKKSEVKV